MSQFLLINGPLRSGKTITEKVLDTHPEIAVLGHGFHAFFRLIERRWLEQRGIPHANRPLNIETSRWPVDSGTMFTETHFEDGDLGGVLTCFREEMEEETLRVPNADSFSRPSDQFLTHIEERYQPGSALDVLRGLLEAVKSYKGKPQASYVGFMEQNLEPFYEPLARALGGDLRVIQLMRDPRSIFTSRNLGSYAKTDGLGKVHPVLAIARPWRVAAKLAREFEAHYPGALYRLHFESLMSEPEETTKEVCRFLGLTYDPKMIDPSSFQTMSGRKWKNNSAFGEAVGFSDKTAVKRFKGVLPEEVQSVLEYCLYMDMLREGYLPECDPAEGFLNLAQFQETKYDSYSPWTIDHGLLLDQKKQGIRNLPSPLDEAMKPLAVVGLYRSGTTLMQKILNAKPEIAIINHGIFGILQIIEKKFYSQNYQQTTRPPLGMDFEVPTPEHRHLLDTVHITEEEIQGFLDFIRSDIQTDLSGKIDLSHPTEKWLKAVEETVRPGTGKQVFDQLLVAIAKYKAIENPMYCGYKEVFTEQFTEPMVVSYQGEARVLHMIRDPRAVLASRNYSKKFVETRSLGKRHSIAVIAANWRTSARYAWYNQLKYPKSHMTVRYEDLVSQPDQVVPEICAFLGLEYSSAMVDVGSFKTERGEAWTQNTSYEKKPGFVTDSIHQWRENLPKEEMALLEYLCRDEMIREGYFPESSEGEGYEALNQRQEKVSELSDWNIEKGVYLSEPRKREEILRRFVHNG